MQTNRKTLGIIVIALGLIAIILIIYFGFIRKSAPTTETPINNQDLGGQLPAGPETGTTTPSDRPRDRRTYDISQEKPHEFNQNDLAKRAMFFSERLGSYSNQSDYGNFTDLKIYMTDSFKDWVDKYVAGLKSQSSATAGYYGISTKALTTEVKSFDDQAGQASIVVTTERRESTEKINGGTPYQQKLDLDFLKVNGEWLVDRAYWEKK